MRRLRLVFALLAALLWLPLLLLVGYALRTVEQEEAGRYKAVADRIFDEMERELTALLRREEERPVDDYAFASGAPASPLQERPSEPFVLGYVEIGPDGRIRLPRWCAGDPELAGLLASSMAGQRDDGARTAPKDNPSKQQAATAAPAQAAQSPGSTLELKRQGEPESKRYDVLSQLNRGVWMREQSQQAKVLEAEPDRAARDGAVDSGAFAGDQPDSDHMILLRDAERAGTHVRQGLVLSLPRLVAWLGQRVLSQGELAQAAELELVPDADEASYRLHAYPGDHSYRHRFGQPFGSLVALLTLDALAELEASGYSYGLSLLLLLTATLALYAGYRMVAAVVSYSERRNDFVSAVSHELKTPLTAIRMYGEMLRDDIVPDPSKRNRYYRIITAESERLTRLINNVLELSKIERGQRSLSLVVGDVTGVAREVLEVLEPHAAELGFELRLEAEPDLPAVRFDRDALSQVLFNLVDNALKYASEADQRSVLLRCERAGAGVAIRVADRGPGVARRHLRHIFKPFYRGERELTRRHKGTGIGLALVRGLVERMGGQVAGRNTEPGFEVCVTLGR